MKKITLALLLTLSFSGAAFGSANPTPGELLDYFGNPKSDFSVDTVQKMLSQLKSGDEIFDIKEKNGKLISRSMVVIERDGLKHFTLSKASFEASQFQHPPVVMNGERMDEPSSSVGGNGPSGSLEPDNEPDLDPRPDPTPRDGTRARPDDESENWGRTNTQKRQEGPAQGRGEGQRENQAGQNWGDALGSAAQAGGQAAIGKGLEMLVAGPAQRRELDRLKQEFEKARAGSEASRRALLEELSRYNQQTEKMLGETMRDWKSYRPLRPAESRDLKSAMGKDPVGRRILETERKMRAFRPQNEHQANFRDASLKANAAAGQEWAQGSHAMAEKLAAVAELFSDVATGLNPPLSLAKDGYEFFTGRHALTGRPLDPVERGLAGLGLATGLATAGMASSVVDGAQIAAKIGLQYGGEIAGTLKSLSHATDLAHELGIRTGQGMVDFVRFAKSELQGGMAAAGSAKSLRESLKLGKWADAYSLQRIQDANKLNAAAIAKNPGFKAAYKPGSKVFDLTLKEDATFLRLYAERTELVKGVPRQISNMKGRWVIRAEAVDKALTPGELMKKYSLPYPPNAVAEVQVPAGTLLRRSKVNSAFGGAEGAIQYEILDNLESAVRFKPKSGLNYGKGMGD